MKGAEPQIIKQFPVYRDRILRLCVDDKVTEELCTDYDLLINTIKVREIKQGANKQFSKTYKYLLELKQQLESEMLERLRNQQ